MLYLFEQLSSKISFLFHLIIYVEQNLVIWSSDVMILLLSHLELKSQYQCLIFVLLWYIWRLESPVIVGTGTAVYTSSWVAPRSDVHSQQRFFYMGQVSEVDVSILFLALSSLCLIFFFVCTFSCLSLPLSRSVSFWYNFKTSSSCFLLAAYRHLTLSFTW